MRRQGSCISSEVFTFIHVDCSTETLRNNYIGHPYNIPHPVMIIYFSLKGLYCWIYDTIRQVEERMWKKEPHYFFPFFFLVFTNTTYYEM